MAAIQLPADLLAQDDIPPPPQPPNPPLTPNFTDAITFQQALVDAYREFRVWFALSASLKIETFNRA